MQNSMPFIYESVATSLFSGCNLDMYAHFINIKIIKFDCSLLSRFSKLKELCIQYGTQYQITILLQWLYVLL